MRKGTDHSLLSPCCVNQCIHSSKDKIMDILYSLTQPELLIVWAICGPLYFRATVKWIRSINESAK